MPAPAIAAASRYTFRGTGKWYWVVTIANINAPSGAELNAGTDLSPEVMDSSGFGVQTTQIDAPDVANRFTAKIPGIQNAADSSLTMYQSETGTDARQLMPEGAVGNICIFPGGHVTARKMSVWPVRVAGIEYVYSSSGDAPDTMVFSFSPTRVPSQNIAVP